MDETLERIQRVITAHQTELNRLRSPGGAVVMKAYVLVNATQGRSLELARLIREVSGVRAAEAITGEYDIVVTCESPDINALGALIVDGIQRQHGVHKTTTCLVIS